MIRAKHSKSAKFIFDLYLNKLIKSSFSDFYLVNDVPEIDDSAGLLITPNHFSWWDGFFIYWVLNKKFRRKIHVMMLEEQLKNYWFFNHIGCYSINLQNNRSTISTLRYTLDILSERKNSVVIYPQGEIQPYEYRPAELKGGINFLAEKTEHNFTVLPVAFKIHYSNEKLPAVYTRFGKIIKANDLRNNPRSLREAFTENLDLLDRSRKDLKFQSIL